MTLTEGQRRANSEQATRMLLKAREAAREARRALVAALDGGKSNSRVGEWGVELRDCAHRVLQLEVQQETGDCLRSR